jgi:hypothetical protein
MRRVRSSELVLRATAARPAPAIEGASVSRNPTFEEEAARAVAADYDQVRTWSDPSARQRELARIGATAVDLLRRLSAHDSTVGHPKRRVHDPRSGETSRPTHGSGARI